MGCGQSKFLDPYYLEKAEKIEPEQALEKDPDAQFESYVERRFIKWAVHPQSNELLRCQILKTNVPLDGGKQGTEVRWGRFWLKEPGSDVKVPDSSIQPTRIPDEEEINPVKRYSHYLSFVQTVGMPCVFYDLNEDIFCRDNAEQWHSAKIVGVEKNYYFVRYLDAPELASEWVHRYSTRLRKQQKYEGRKRIAGDSLWSTFFELDWIRVRHPSSNQYMPAKIISKDEKERAMVVQYDDGALLVRQETLTESMLEKDRKKIENYANWKKRWRYNRLFIFVAALKAVGLIIHNVVGENGHSLFRSLSHQLFGTEDNWEYLRRLTHAHLKKEKAYFQSFVDVNYEAYLAHKEKGISGEFFAMGDHLDIQAVCEIFDVQVEIFSELSPRPLETIRFYQQMSRLKKIRLSYRGANHYDSVSHVDEPLPLTVEVNLRPVPMGTRPWKTRVVLQARQELFNNPGAVGVYVPETVLKRETFSKVVLALVRIEPAKIEVVLKELELPSDEARGLSDSPPLENPGKGKVKIIEASDGKDLSVVYPFYPSILAKERNPDQVPSFRLEGLDSAVDRACQFLKRHATSARFYTISVGARMTAVKADGIHRRKKVVK